MALVISREVGGCGGGREDIEYLQAKRSLVLSHILQRKNQQLMLELCLCFYNVRVCKNYNFLIHERKAGLRRQFKIQNKIIFFCERLR
jgi:hypothetical protein